jgi:hypothetical protein
VYSSACESLFFCTALNPDAGWSEVNSACGWCLFTIPLTCSRLVLTFEMFLMVYTCSYSELLLRKKSIQICFTVTVPTVKLCGKINPSFNSPFRLQFGKASPQCICVLSETAGICTMILLFLWDCTKKNSLLLDDGRFRRASYNQRKIMQQCCR